MEETTRGTFWSGTVIDTKTRLRVGRAIEKTEEEVAQDLMKQVKRYAPDAGPPALVTDGKGAYREAMLKTWGKVPEYGGRGAPPKLPRPGKDWHYVQIIKKRKGGKLESVRFKVIFWISIDNFDAYTFQFASFSFLNNLDVMPVFSWPRKFWWRSPPTILWYFSPGFEHCFAISSFSISRHGWRTCFWCIPFYLFHQTLRNFFFRFLYGTPNPQTGLRVYRCSTPKSSS